MRSFIFNFSRIKTEICKKVNEIVTERTKIMELDKDQTKSIKEIFTKRFLEIQNLTEKPGTDEYKAKVREISKKHNKLINEITAPEQRKKWQKYAKAKRAKN